MMRNWLRLDRRIKLGLNIFLPPTSSHSPARNQNALQEKSKNSHKHQPSHSHGVLERADFELACRQPPSFTVVPILLSAPLFLKLIFHFPLKE